VTDTPNAPTDQALPTAPVSSISATRRLWARLLAPAQLIAKHINAWHIAWAEQKRQEPLVVPQGLEREFLPAVLELQETPPAPLGRITAYVISAMFALALLWASIGKIDIVATAQGKIIPSDYSKIIQPLESGVVKAIRVRDGQPVKKGDILVELDTANAFADRERFANEHAAALTEAARIRALLTGNSDFVPPRNANPTFVLVQRNRLREQLAEFETLQSQAEAYKKLYDKQLVSKMQYYEAERKRAEKAQEYSAALAEAETRAHSLSKELVKAETRAIQQTLTAPIDGVVQQLAIHTVGGVVTPAQQLMVVAPREGQLEVEAWVENKDIGFVNPGQEAEIKIEAFPFTRYGIVEGKLITLSTDAVPIEKVGLVYTAKVTMAKSAIQVENKLVNLSPGMNVTVEIKTGHRRLIEYFLDPVLRGVKETARER